MTRKGAQALVGIVLTVGLAIAGWQVYRSLASALGSHHYEFSQTELQSALNDHLRSVPASGGFTISGVDLQLQDSTMRIVLSLEGQYLGRKTSLTAMVDGVPHYGAIRGSFYMTPTTVSLVELRAEGSGPAELSDTKGGDTANLKLAIESAAESIFSTARAHELDSDFGRWTWANHAEVRNGVMIIDYSFVEATFHFMVGVFVFAMLLLLVIGFYLNPEMFLVLILLSTCNN